LTEMEIAKANRSERFQFIGGSGHVAEKVEAVIDGHLEDVGDVEAFVGDFERLAIEATATARLAGHIDRRQEIHLDLDHAIAFAVFATPALHVEAEPARPVTAHAGRRQLREEIADRIERAGVGERIRARGAPDRCLVDDDSLVNQVEPVDGVMRTGRLLGVIEMPKERATKHNR